MNKGKIGLERINKLSALEERYTTLKEGLDSFNQALYELGYNKKVLKGPERILNIIDKILKSFQGVEFLDKESYINFLNELKEIDNIYDNAKEACRIIGSDFCDLSMCEFVWLGLDLLEIATYDSIICPDYPCTSEIFNEGKFSYYNIDDETNEIVIDSAEKCWDYLKENYDALED